MRKGQMEIFGMVFVVLLIFVGFLIYVSLGRFNLPQESPGAEYERTQMASNFIDAILKVTTNCSNQDIGYLIAACENPAATTGSLVCGDGKNPCEVAKAIIKTGLNQTLGQLGYEYRLTFSARQGTDFVEKFSIPNASLNCNEKVKPGIYPFQSHLTRNMLQVRLDICRRV